MSSRESDVAYEEPYETTNAGGSELRADSHPDFQTAFRRTLNNQKTSARNDTMHSRTYQDVGVRQFGDGMLRCGPGSDALVMIS